MRLYQAALGLDDPAVVAMAARQSFASIVAQGPVDGETFCQFRSVSLVVVVVVAVVVVVVVAVVVVVVVVR